MTGQRLAIWWIDRYTRGLPEATRIDRCAELASDVWEHHTESGPGPHTELAIAWRCLRGIPADLSWRRASLGRRHIPSRQTVARSLGWAAAGMAYAFLIALHGMLAVTLVGLENQPSDWDDTGATVYAGLGATVLALLMLGAFLLRTRPRAGATLVVVGALTPIVAFWWGAFVYVPVGAAVATAAIVLARRRRRTLQIMA